ncbi:hypothetical protein EV694_1337 [Volucribacter psittacicida]|uniref:Uncharacterized protein n=1 Tax=Volucribacter psittacicida TaxID=203482 RepID=A0A4V2PBW2_9PAST|nr:hypothetical protein EV694_1337 [Volucribacter psittacicida]
MLLLWLWYGFIVLAAGLAFCLRCYGGEWTRAVCTGLVMMFNILLITRLERAELFGHLWAGFALWLVLAGVIAWRLKKRR